MSFVFASHLLLILHCFSYILILSMIRTSNFSPIESSMNSLDEIIFSFMFSSWEGTKKLWNLAAVDLGNVVGEMARN